MTLINQADFHDNHLLEDSSYAYGFMNYPIVASNFVPIYTSLSMSLASDAQSTGHRDEYPNKVVCQR